MTAVKAGAKRAGNAGPHSLGKQVQVTLCFREEKPPFSCYKRKLTTREN